jgi:DNA-binding MarR family transcriptional regulator
MENLMIIKDFGILYRTFLNYISKSIASKDLSFSDSVFLVNIGENEGIGQEEIANALAIDKAAIARSVKNMEQKGYMRSRKSATDKRVKELYLSETGKELFQYMMDLNKEWLKQVLGNLDPDEIRDFTKIINDISERAKNIKKSSIDVSPEYGEADGTPVSH